MDTHITQTKMGGFTPTHRKQTVCEGLGWIKLDSDIPVAGSCKILATLRGSMRFRAFFGHASDH
jgi:hypothetical protein